MQPDKFRLHLLFTADILRQLLTNLMYRIRRRVPRHPRGESRVERRPKHRFLPEFRRRKQQPRPSTLFSPIFSLAREKIGPSETYSRYKSATTSQSRLRRASSPGRGAKECAPSEVLRSRSRPLSQPAAASSPERGAFSFSEYPVSGEMSRAGLTEKCVICIIQLSSV